MKIKFFILLFLFCFLCTPFVGIKSGDLSSEWFSYSQGLPESITITSIASNPREHLVMIGTNQGVFLSLDAGESWEEKSLGLTDKMIQCIFFEENTQYFFVGTKQTGVFRYNSVANKWTSFNSNLPSRDIQVISASAQYLYAGTKTDGLFRVKHGSEKWVDLNFDDKNPIIKKCEYRGILPISDQLVFCATSKGLLVTDNSGENWRMFEDNSMLGTSLLSISMDPHQPTRILIGTETKGLIESLDQGKTFHELSVSFGKGKESKLRSIIFDQKKPKTLFVASQNNIFGTIDDGKTWKQISKGLENIIISVIALIQDRSEICLSSGSEGSGFFVLRDAKPPYKPTSLRAQMNGSSVILNWEPSKIGSNSIAGYNVYKKRNTIQTEFTKIAFSTDLKYQDDQVTWNEKLLYRITAFDNSSQSLESNPSNEVAILVDDLPSIKIVEPKDGSITDKQQISVEGSVIDLGSGIAGTSIIISSESGRMDEYPLSLKGDGSFVQPISLSIGTNNLNIIAVDNNHLTSEFPLTILRKMKDPDTTPPEIITNQPNNDFVLEEDVLTVSGTIKDRESGLFEAKIWNSVDGNRLGSKVIQVNSDGFFIEKLPVQIGKNTVTIQAIDGAGNIAEKVISGIVRKPDITPPKLIVLEPADAFITEENAITIRGRSTDENSGIESTIIMLEYLGKVMYEKNLKLDESGFFSEIFSLMEGENSFTIIAKDKRNNVSKINIKGNRIPKAEEIIISLQIGLKKATINGEEKLLQTAPEIKKGKTYVPIRFIAEAFGANVNWVSSRKEIQITYRDVYITLWLNQTIISVESLTDITKIPVTKFLDVAPYLLNGVTMVPLRFIIEEWKTTMVWDNDAQKITIYLKK